MEAIDDSNAKTSAESLMSKEDYYDKVLGMLVGSAIGDAMGAPTEMWARRDIIIEYGHVDKLDTMVRAPSPEGTWVNNLPAGGTTDDTRWKALVMEWGLEHNLKNLNARTFAKHIVDQYKEDLEALKEIESFDPKPYEDQTLKIAWLQEWALIAEPYLRGDIDDFRNASDHFYGGEMNCSGMLFSPTLGAFFPADPEKTYEVAFDLAMFDLGFGRDMAGLVAAMTAAAFSPDATPQSVMNVMRTVDPQKYFESRLVGRSAYRYYQQCRAWVHDVKNISEADPDITVPRHLHNMDKLEYTRYKTLVGMLDEANKDIPWNPAEIFQQTLTPMLYYDFDFSKTMTFITNYGRDNDTVAAVAGAVLGAYWGVEKLPKKMVEQTITVNRDLLDIDLEQLASQLANAMYK
jgi:hypothetical protein